VRHFLSLRGSFFSCACVRVCSFFIESYFTPHKVVYERSAPTKPWDDPQRRIMIAIVVPVPVTVVGEEEDEEETTPAAPVILGMTEKVRILLWLWFLLLLLLFFDIDDCEPIRIRWAEWNGGRRPFMNEFVLIIHSNHDLLTLSFVRMFTQIYCYPVSVDCCCLQ
jgi:hypothetical protein